MQQRHLKISDRVGAGPNAIRAMFNFAATLNASRNKEGEKPLLSLGIGAPNIPANPVIDLANQKFLAEKEELRQSLKKNPQDLSALQSLVNLETYLPSGGTPEACQAGASLINHWYPNLNAKASEICITYGCSQAISSILHVFVGPGVKVGCFSPYFPPYATMTQAFGGQLVSVPSRDCRPNSEELEKTLRENPTIDLFILNDPGNPSGCKLSKGELEALGKVFSKPEFKHIYLILDETYHEFVFSEDQRPFFLDVVPLEEFRHRTAIVTGLSKCLGGNPGLRAGLAFTPDMLENGKTVSIGAKMAIAMLDSTGSVSTVLQHILTYVVNAKLGRGRPEDHQLQKEWELSAASNYRMMMGIAKELFHSTSHLPFVVQPEGAFFGIISAHQLIGKPIPESCSLLSGKHVTDLPNKIGAKTFETDVNIAYFFIYAAEVVTIPASGFDYDPTHGHLRISFAVSPEQLKEASTAMLHAVVQALK